MAGAAGLAAFALWVFVVEGYVFLQSPPRLVLGISLSLNVALATLLILLARVRPSH